MDWFTLLVNLVAALLAQSLGVVTTQLWVILTQVVQWLVSIGALGNGGSTGVQPLPTAPLTATPELGSLVLFGSGLVGAGGYALTRFRARRRV